MTSPWSAPGGGPGGESWEASSSSRSMGDARRGLSWMGTGEVAQQPAELDAHMASSSPTGKAITGLR